MSKPSCFGIHLKTGLLLMVLTITPKAQIVNWYYYQTNYQTTLDFVVLGDSACQQVKIKHSVF